MNDYIDEYIQIAKIIYDELKEKVNIKNLCSPEDEFFNSLMNSLDEVASGRFDEKLDDYIYTSNIESNLKTIQIYMKKEIAAKIYPVLLGYKENHIGNPICTNEYQYDSLLDMILFSLDIYRTGEYNELLNLKLNGEILTNEQKDRFDKANVGITLLSDYLITLWS